MEAQGVSKPCPNGSGEAAQGTAGLKEPIASTKPRRRDYREERGDFTIALLLLSVILLAIAGVAYAWPKAISTRLTVEHIGEESLKAGAIYAVRTALPTDDEDGKLDLVEERVLAFITDSRINGVSITLVEGPTCGEFQGESYLRASFEWLFLNPRSVVDVPGDINRSTQHAFTDDLGVCD